MKSNSRTMQSRLSGAIALLTVTLLAACKPMVQTPVLPGEPTPIIESSPELTPVPDDTPVPPTATAAPDFLVPLEQLNGLKLIFSHPWTGETALRVDELVDSFNQTNQWGIHIMVTRTGSSQALADQVEDGPFDAEYPQVVVAPSEHLLWWLENGNLVRPLNDLISDPNFGLSEQQRADFPLAFWQQDQSGGSQVGIPAQRDVPVLFYNQTWAAELGFTQPPVTTDDFKEQACAAAFVNAHDRFAANDGTGGWIVNTDGLVVYSWLRSFGLENALSGESLQFQFNQPETENALGFIRSMVDESCAWFSRTTASNEYFANRQALFYAGLLSDLALQARTNTRLESTDSWTVLPFPDSDRPVTVATGLSYGILRSDQAAEVAGWLFVRWMSQPENAVQLLLAGGGLPVSGSAVELAQAQMQATPQWAQTLQWIPTVQSAPPVAGWRIARFVLQDAFWQALQPFTVVDDIPLILEQLDATILEVQSQQGQ
ncbi:MAG TPA: extracellular solute-binding protein [Bellilinea sp.]|nr:extracellular solute-binding protein [Bellilinea sp.]